MNLSSAYPFQHWAALWGQTNLATEPHTASPLSNHMQYARYSSHLYETHKIHSWWQTYNCMQLLGDWRTTVDAKPHAASPLWHHMQYTRSSEWHDGHCHTSTVGRLLRKKTQIVTMNGSWPIRVSIWFCATSGGGGEAASVSCLRMSCR